MRSTEAKRQRSGDDVMILHAVRVSATDALCSDEAEERKTKDSIAVTWAYLFLDVTLLESGRNETTEKNHILIYYKLYFVHIVFL